MPKSTDEITFDFAKCVLSLNDNLNMPVIMKNREDATKNREFMVHAERCDCEDMFTFRGNVGEINIEVD